MFEFIQSLIINFGIGAALGIVVALIIKTKNYIKKTNLEKEEKEKLKKEKLLEPTFIEKILSN